MSKLAEQMDIENDADLDPVPVGPADAAIAKRVAWLASLGRPRGICVALAGPDGVGKSTAVDAVREWFERELPFVKIELRRWRPGLLPDLGSFVGRPNEAGAPRKTPGRFQFVRLFYYLFDFWLGTLWKDRRRSSFPKVIIYDRCALDMRVHPVRFGLRSARGTKLLWRVTRKPDLVIFLSDSPARILERKRELEKHEVEEQLETWLQLAQEGKVRAIIRIDAGAEEIGARVRDLLLETLVRENEAEAAGAGAPEQGLRRIGSILTGNADSAELSTTGEKAGWEETARFAVLPTSSSPRFLVPLEPRQAAGRSLDVYNAQKPFARLCKQLLRAGLRAGVAQPLLRDRASLLVRSDIAKESRDLVLLREHLGKVLGRDDIAVSVSLGTPGVYQKPALQVMDGAGTILGYAKVGWNPDTIGLVQNEESTLKTLQNAALGAAIVPRVLHAGWWNGFYLLVQEPAVGSSRKPPVEIDSRHIRFLVELLGAFPTQGALPWSEITPQIHRRLEQLKAGGFHYYAHTLETAVKYCRGRVGSASVPCGLGHRDFAPWNTRVRDSRLIVFDWEYADSATPAGWDLFHFLVEAAVELQGKSAAEIYRSILGPGAVRSRVEGYFQSLGLSQDWIEPLFVSYLAEALNRNLDLEERTLGSKDGLLRRTYGTLLALVCRTGAGAR